MVIDPNDYRIRVGKDLDLEKWPTMVAPAYRSAADYKDLAAAHVKDLSRLQQQLYACNSHALLVIFQAMDAAGKDGTISHVMSGVNPQGCQVFTFKHPSAVELQHDFLWRTTRALPERGRIGIFNRSYYEEVLIARVHPEILHREGVPDAPRRGEAMWRDRYRSIVDMERHLSKNGLRIVKFYLHMSKEEQRRRLISRIDDPNKNWKFSNADIVERKFWDDYMRAYEACLSATTTKAAPWYVVPADDKKNARLIVSKIIVATLAELGMTYPQVGAERKNELQALREQLVP